MCVDQQQQQQGEKEVEKKHFLVVVCCMMVPFIWLQQSSLTFTQDNQPHTRPAELRSKGNSKKFGETPFIVEVIYQVQEAYMQDSLLFPLFWSKKKASLQHSLLTPLVNVPDHHQEPLL